MSDIGAQDYNPTEIETVWQQRWEAEGSFVTRDDLPRAQCYYVLEMFPYPSGKLHMGHVRNYTIGDAVARYQRLRGLHVLHPMGWDSFGLPAEQAAIDRDAHPKTWTYENIDHMRGQLKRMGFSYDWNREFATSDPGYAHREQQLFLELVDQGLVYRKSAIVNWSTGLNCVLANEQVHDGKCWRTGMPVIQKELPQWFVRSTAYAQELLDDLTTLDQWPEAVRKQQTDWLGRSRGAEIDFPVEGHDLKLTVFTTRPDTVFGVTFMSIAPDHPLVGQLVSEAQSPAIAALREEIAAQSADERTGADSPKKGVATGAWCINPVSGTRVPIYAANFVLADYGTGAVMAVPAHDTRDFAFAQAHDLPIMRVIAEDGVDPAATMTEAFTGVGTMMASDQFDGLRSDAGIDAVIDWLAEQGFGREAITWRYRDWGVSRQRYWGNPIPYVYGESMGMVPLRPQDLPVCLPEDVVFDGRGNPLERHPTWATTAADGSPLMVATPAGREPARRETDTLDTFFESSWYFARYTCADAEEPLDRTRVDHWLPVDLYIGGIEHACMHLLYARFFQKALCDLGHSNVREPFKRLLCQGMVVAETYYREDSAGNRTWFNPAEVSVEHDERGQPLRAQLRSDGQPVVIGRIEKMSKSKNNGVDPQTLIGRYGADATRLYALRAAPPEKDLYWDDAGLAGDYRFLRRLWTHIHDRLDTLRTATSGSDDPAAYSDSADQALARKLHATIKRASDAMDRDFAFNTAIAACMELFNALDSQDADLRRRVVESLLLLLAPMTPHICAELWHRLGNGDLATAHWPQYRDDAILEDSVRYPVQVKGAVRGHLELPRDLDRAALEDAVRAHPLITDLLAGRELKRLIVVPGKIVNLVV